jgi:hypothetical protein
MRFGRAATNIGTAAVLLNLVACQTVGTSSAGSPDPTARAYTSADLASIVVTQDTAPEGLTVEEGDSGLAALTLPLPPDRDTPFDTTAFVDALTTRIEHSMTGGYTSWSALFETADAAERAFEFIAKQHESEDGWGLQPSRPDLNLGDESVYYTGPAYGWNTAGIYFWRESNLLLAAVGTEAYKPELLRSIAEGMDARAG